MSLQFRSELESKSEFEFELVAHVEEYKSGPKEKSGEKLLCRQHNGRVRYFLALAGVTLRDCLAENEKKKKKKSLK